MASGAPTERDFTLALLIAEEDDLGDEIVRVVQAMRRSGTEPEIVTIDGPAESIDAFLRRGGPGVYFLCLTDNVAADRVQEIKQRFADDARPDRKLYAVRLDAAHAKAVASIEARLTAWTRARELEAASAPAPTQPAAIDLGLGDLSGVLDLGAVLGREQSANARPTVRAGKPASATARSSSDATTPAIAPEPTPPIVSTATPSPTASPAIPSTTAAAPPRSRRWIAVASIAAASVVAVGVATSLRDRDHGESGARELAVPSPAPALSDTKLAPHEPDSPTSSSEPSETATEGTAVDTPAAAKCREVRAAAARARAARRWQDELTALEHRECWTPKLHEERVQRAKQRLAGGVVEAATDGNADATPDDEDAATSGE